MTNKKIQAPKRDIILFENIFLHSNEEQILIRLQGGLVAVKNNAKRLIDDAEALFELDRCSSAAFLLATANEELAKIFIILDMCRLDFVAHQSTLKKLCRAFYDHVMKWAYIKTINKPYFHEMDNIGEIWNCETTKYWTSDPESGEPSFPHETNFYRELPLYVDFIEYDQEWHIPEGSSHRWVLEGFDNSSSHLSEVKSLYDEIDVSFHNNVFSEQALKIFHDQFKKKYISPRISSREIDKIYDKISNEFEFQSILEKENLIHTILYRWPLYYFVANS